MPTSVNVTRGVRAIACCCVLVLLSCGGCALPGALAWKAFGSPKVQAEYAPPKDQRLLVLVESYNGPSDLQQPADQLASEVSSQLDAQKVAPLVPASELFTLRTTKPDQFRKMKIEEVGRELGAKQVIYVDLRRCDVEGVQGSDALRGHVQAFVRVVDVATGKTRWPETGAGREFKANTDFALREGRHTEGQIRDQMLDELADSISTLFYTHQPDSEVPKNTVD